MGRGFPNAAPADPTVEFATLEVDGTSYRLAYNFRAIAEAEALVECNLLQGIAALLMHGTTAAQMLGLLYAALRKAQPKMTVDQAGALIRLDTLPDIREALLKAYNNSLPEAKKILKDPSGGAEAAAPVSN